MLAVSYLRCGRKHETGDGEKRCEDEVLHDHAKLSE
jgi:hypothetical protein